MQSYRPNEVLSTAQGLWEALQQLVTEQRPSIGGPMQHGRPLALDEHRLIVGFAHKFSLEYLRDPEIFGVVREAAQTLLGRSFHIALESLDHQGDKYVAESRDRQTVGELPVTNFEEKIHHTWVQLLLDTKYRELAALIVEGTLSIEEWYHPDGARPPRLENIFIDLPPSAYTIVITNKLFQETLIKSLAMVTKGYLHTEDNVEKVPIKFRIKLLEFEGNWKQKVKNLIINAKESNQGLITEKAFGRRGEQPLLYNEMRFASRSEIRIAQELEEKRVLFFPLPLAVRSDTGALYEDHREVDFLICQDGAWGILEVAYHPDRYEKDSEKDIWFKKSGILCIQHYTAERCFNDASEVVNGFLQILAKHKK